MNFLDELAARRRFGMKPGLDAIRGVAAALGDPQNAFPSVHVAGTNGKGAVCAMLDACLRSAGFRVGRYTSPHLVNINERFFIDGRPVGDAALETAAERVRTVAPEDLTFFEALTAVAFEIFAGASLDYAVLETGLGGRLDATNICRPALCVITRIGRDHCDWLGDTVTAIASEKAGIVKPGVPVVLGENTPEVRDLVARRAADRDAPFVYAPDVLSVGDIPAGFSLSGSFNRENAVTALAALAVLLAARTGASLLPAEAFASVCERVPRLSDALKGMSRVAWPGRFQRLGSVLVDGAHNPPAARALAAALAAEGVSPRSLTLIAGFCGDKDVDEVLRILAPFVSRGIAVATNNPRSLPAADVADRMSRCGMTAVAADSLAQALSSAGADPSGETLVCGSLFLAGEALVALGATPWDVSPRFDPAEQLRLG